MFNNFFFENRTLCEIMSKHVVVVQAHAHAHALEHKHAHAHTHTRICNIYRFSTATIIRERASILRYTYIVCLVSFCFFHTLPLLP